VTITRDDITVRYILAEITPINTGLPIVEFDKDNKDLVDITY